MISVSVPNLNQQQLISVSALMLDIFASVVELLHGIWPGVNVLGGMLPIGVSSRGVYDQGVSVPGNWPATGSGIDKK